MRRLAGVLCLSLQLLSSRASAGEAPSALAREAAGEPLDWKWVRFGTVDYLVTGGGAAITLATAIVRPRPEHSLSGGIWFDEAARRALRPDDIRTRYAFRTASGVGVSLTIAWPLVADSLVTAWWHRGSRDVAQEMALIDLEALAITGAVQGTTNVLVSRERPYGRDCGTTELPETAGDCEGSVHYRSFFSGHSAFSFTGAALLCVHHFENELLGAPWDALSCAGGYAVAASTATFRVVGDMHYASDAITGALVGTIVGYGVPLLHYRQPALGTVRANGVTVRIVPSVGGLGVLGAF